MSENDDKKRFLDIILQESQEKSLHKLSLSKAKGDGLPKNIFVRIFEKKNVLNFSFTHRFETQDKVENFSLKAGIQHLESLLGHSFLEANAQTGSQNFTLKFNRHRVPKLISRKLKKGKEKPLLVHDRPKQYALSPSRPFLKILGITNDSGNIKKEKFNKFKQVSKFVEIADGLIGSLSLKKELKILDMGAGKGYLTLALYDHFTQNSQLDLSIKGVEFRPDLVETINHIAEELAFKKLLFVPGQIEQFPDETHDVLIALHACDTATDDALTYGIRNNAKAIIVSPCCQKQVRRNMNPGKELSSMLKHGILLERQAEMLTDAIRGLILEGFGYKTKIFEFIQADHTGKNIMITAEKKGKVDFSEIKPQIEALKKTFGLKYHYLESIIPS